MSNNTDLRPPWLWGPGWRRPVRADEPGAAKLRAEAAWQCYEGDREWLPIAEGKAKAKEASEP